MMFGTPAAFLQAVFAFEKVRGLGRVAGAEIVEYRELGEQRCAPERDLNLIAVPEPDVRVDRAARRRAGDYDLRGRSRRGRRELVNLPRAPASGAEKLSVGPPMKTAFPDVYIWNQVPSGFV